MSKETPPPPRTPMEMMLSLDVARGCVVRQTDQSINLFGGNFNLNAFNVLYGDSLLIIVGADYIHRQT